MVRAVATAAGGASTVGCRVIAAWGFIGLALGLALYGSWRGKPAKPMTDEQKLAERRRIALAKINQRFNESDPTQRHWWG